MKGELTLEDLFCADSDEKIRRALDKEIRRAKKKKEVTLAKENIKEEK